MAEAIRAYLHYTGSMDAVPSYTADASAGTTKRTFSEHGVTVHVLSQAASKTSPPTYHNEGIVSGSVEFILKDGLFSATKGITLELLGFERKLFDLGSGPGRMNQTNLAEVPFFSARQVLYDRAQQTLPPGRHAFPFQLAFPASFTSTSKKSPNEQIALPPTFQVPGYPTYLQYQLKCVVRHAGLADDTIVRIPLNYVPRREAGAPSPPRALAYETGTPLPDPLVDPEGWHRVSADVDLRVFGARNTHLHVTLSLPRPLEYPRGYPVPLHLALTCADAEARDLLSAKGLSITLQRRMFMSQLSSQKSAIGPDSRQWMASIAAKGRYWPAEASPEDQDSRNFEGEISVSNQVVQGFEFPKVSLSYTIDLTLQATGITSSAEGAIISIPVDVTYFPAKNSPRPISYAPSPPEPEDMHIPAPDESSYFMMNY